MASPKIRDIFRTTTLHASAPGQKRGGDAGRVVFLSATRTPFGSVGGAFRDFTGIDLAVHAARAAIEQAGLTDRRDLIDAAIFGNAMHTSNEGRFGASPMRPSAFIKSFSDALTANRICWSG